LILSIKAINPGFVNSGESIMTTLSRRSFGKNLAQGVMAIGAGSVALPSLLQAQLTQQSPHPPRVSAEIDWNEFEVYYPDTFNEGDALILRNFQAQLDRINKRGNFDIESLENGKLKDVPGTLGGHQITLEEMNTFARTYLDGNLLFLDKAYASKTSYGNPIAHPMIYEPYVFPYIALDSGIGDYMVVSRHNDTHNYYRPYFEGDIIFVVVDEQQYVETTPPEGSYYRSFAMIVRARYFNQKSELVGETGTILEYSFRRHKDPSKRNPDKTVIWENPDWWHSRPIHQYTDDDWNSIRALWKNEKRRGSTPLFWDDVKIGDELTPTAIGPMLPDQDCNIMFNALQWTAEIKKNVLAPETFKNMVKNKQGIYVLPEHCEIKHADGPFPDKELANRDGRCKLSNGVAPKCAVGMICNWIGDAGWIQRIGWSQMTDLPGYDTSVIPDYPKSAMPALFDKYPYLDNVSELKGQHDTHPLQGDLYINRGRVTAKYVEDGDHLIDIIWWTESHDKYLLGEGSATVKLPRKSDFSARNS
jgi:acyl dehydratase